MANHSISFQEVYRVGGRIQEEEPTWGTDYEIGVIKEVRKGDQIISRDAFVKDGGFFPASDPSASEKAKEFRVS